jgi:ABC-type Fe3+ transport system substrate-binding protein
MNISGGGILKTAPNADNAKKITWVFIN